MDKNNILDCFFEKYPEHKDKKVEIRKTSRFDGDFEIFVYGLYGLFEGDNEYHLTNIYWVKIRENNEIYFEDEEYVNTMRCDIRIDGDIYQRFHYIVDYDKYAVDEGEYTYVDTAKIDAEVLEKFKEEHMQRIKEEVAKKILSGEIELIISEDDTDSYAAPLSQLKYLYRL